MNENIGSHSELGTDLVHTGCQSPISNAFKINPGTAQTQFLRRNVSNKKLEGKKMKYMYRSVSNTPHVPVSSTPKDFRTVKI